MKRNIIQLTVVLLLISITVTAQRKKKQITDTLTVYREFAKLGEWYMNLPIEMKLQYTRSTFPLPMSGIPDSAATDVVLYYGKNDFYMEAEGMEQIANDSLLVIVNNEAKIIKVYSNTGRPLNNLQRSVSLFMPDSSLQKLAQRYSAMTQDLRENVRQITLQSREKISGTELFKETIRMTYKADTYEPISFEQSRRVLLPVDSTVYQTSLLGNAVYQGRLISAKTKEGDLYFLVRDQNTFCRFTKVSRDLTRPPLREQDRVTKEANGNYLPAKGFEDYMVSREW